MAIEDALVLAEVLRTADSVEGALAAYVRRRRPGSCRLPSATPRCVSEETRCFATAIDRSFRRRSRLIANTWAAIVI